MRVQRDQSELLEVFTREGAHRVPGCGVVATEEDRQRRVDTLEHRGKPIASSVTIWIF
jgi:hypothetical protein